MISKKLFIKNRFGEKLETLLEYERKEKKQPIILMVPGFGMTLHEWNGKFDEISEHLVGSGFATFRFSFAGCGNSEGDFTEMTFPKIISQKQTFLLLLSTVQKMKPFQLKKQKITSNI